MVFYCLLSYHAVDVCTPCDLWCGILICPFVSTFLCEGDNYRWIIHPEMLNSTNGTMYVNITVFNYTSSSSVAVNVSLMNFKCVYWDVDQNDWSRDGCWVSVQLSIDVKMKSIPMLCIVLEM